MNFVGIGQDSHRFAKGKRLFLGGIEMPGHDGLEGNSDGDVILHALCNAIGSAMGKGSLSLYSDEMCRKGITDSAEYLKKALGFLDGKKLNNVSISIEGSRPRLEKSIPEMRRRIAELCSIPESRVGMTATTGEGLTAFGRGEGLQAIAIVSIDDQS